MYGKRIKEKKKNPFSPKELKNFLKNSLNRYLISSLQYQSDTKISKPGLPIISHSKTRSFLGGGGILDEGAVNFGL